MTGLLAVVGGNEHTPGCESIDNQLLKAADGPTPVVAVITLAASARTRARVVGLAIEWWEHLGATVLVAPPEPVPAIETIDRADIVVLTGGIPDRLYRRLLGSPLWHRIVERWTDGAHLSGSSSGAMVLAAWRQSVRLPFGVAPGFGLLPSVAVAPHHDLPVPRTVASWRARTHPHVIIVGIDARTGLIGRPPTFEVRGRGRVTVRRGSWQRSLGRGEVLELPFGATPVPAPVAGRDQRPDHAHEQLRGTTGAAADLPHALSTPRDERDWSIRGRR